MTFICKPLNEQSAAPRAFFWVTAVLKRSDHHLNTSPALPNLNSTPNVEGLSPVTTHSRDVSRGARNGAAFESCGLTRSWSKRKTNREKVTQKCTRPGSHSEIDQKQITNKYLNCIYFKQTCGRLRSDLPFFSRNEVWSFVNQNELTLNHRLTATETENLTLTVWG